jgi:hypothetical protein
MMKTTLNQRSKLLYCILICTVIFFWIATAAILKAESGNALTVHEIIGQNLASIELPQVQGPLYLDCSLSKKRFYLGERVPVTITLYISDLVVTNVDEPVLGQPEFLLDKLNNATQQELRINGRPYQVIKFSYLLTPLQAGSFQLGPIRQTLYLASGTGKHRTIEAASKQITVKVLNLPSQGRPENFSGGIGSFRLAVSVTPGQVKLGEPLTLKMELSGSGNLQVVSAPQLKNTTGFKVYGAQKKAGSSTGNYTWGKTVFEQIVIPIDEHVTQIGPFSFAYFDPGNQKYRQLMAPTISIAVKPNPDFKNDLQYTAKPSLQSKIITIKNKLGKLYVKDKQLIRQPWFWFWQLVPLLLLSGAVSYRRYKEFMRSDSERARAIRSYNLVKQELAAARSISAEGRYDDLLEQLHLILRNYLGERFGMATAGMTGSVGKTLAPMGVPPETVEKIQQFFEQYDSHRFALTKLDEAGAAQLWETLNEIIAALDKIKEKN